MSNQRRPQDEQSDVAVSAAYRDLAQEKTPAHLDHVVLNEARKAAQSSRSRNVSWLRPAAWVTTIGLCLAIVLEVTDLVPQDDISAARPVRIEDDESRIEEPAARQKRPASQASGDAPTPSRGEANTIPADMPAPPAADEPEAEVLPPGVPSEAFKSEMTVPMGVQSLDGSDKMMLRDAGESARARPGADRETISPLSKTAYFADMDSERYCDEQETGTPEAWIECIMRLQQAGRHEEARLEHNRLHETFPSAEIPPLTAPLPDSP